MGQCLSKHITLYDDLYQDFKPSKGNKPSLAAFRGVHTYAAKYHIVTPAADRFPPSAVDLKYDLDMRAHTQKTVGCRFEICR